MLRSNDLKALHSSSISNSTLRYLTLLYGPYKQKESPSEFSWLTLKELVSPQRDMVRSKTELFVVEKKSL